VKSGDYKWLGSYGRRLGRYPLLHRAGMVDRRAGSGYMSDIQQVYCQYMSFECIMPRLPELKTSVFSLLVLLTFALVLA